MSINEKNALFTAARQHVKVALMMADSIAECPTASDEAIHRFVSQVARANSAAEIFRNACIPPVISEFE